MQLFVGRQPILDCGLRTYGYELLFRSSETNRFDATNADTASAAVISNTFLSVGADTILGECKGFVNLPRQLLADEVIGVLPHETVVVEILEDVVPDKEVVRACRSLKNAGFQLALDDFVQGPDSHLLTELADLSKWIFARRLVASAGRSRPGTGAKASICWPRKWKARENLMKPALWAIRISRAISLPSPR